MIYVRKEDCLLTRCWMRLRSSKGFLLIQRHRPSEAQHKSKVHWLAVTIQKVNNAVSEGFSLSSWEFPGWAPLWGLDDYLDDSAPCPRHIKPLIDIVLMQWGVYPGSASQKIFIIFLNIHRQYMEDFGNKTVHCLFWEVYSPFSSNTPGYLS